MLTLPSVFSNHMVLQRGKKVKIWGTSDSSYIMIKLKKDTDIIYEAQATVINNAWEVFLPAVEAGGPYMMSIESASDEIILTDIMYGDVWLAGGQSNMELELQNAAGYDEIEDCMDERVRFFYTPKVAYVGEELYEAEANNGWQTNTSQWRKAWSAVGYYFAANLAKKLDIPIGIIGCNWGGTSASCWISQEYIEKEPVLKGYLTEYNAIVEGQDFNQYLKELEEYKIYQEEFDRNVGNYYKTAPNPTWDEAISLFGECKYPGPIGPRSFTRPCGLYESMLKRVMPYTLSGFIFYQGEEDDNRPDTYRTLLTTLINQWRDDWNDSTLPFLNVQLPIYHHDGEIGDFKNWPYIREAQELVSQTVENTGLAVILDKGESLNIHPLDKKTVGYRLALVAFNIHYKLIDSKLSDSPHFVSYELGDNYIDIVIENGKGLHSIDENGNWNEFEIAGNDCQYQPATVVGITENDNHAIIRLKSEKVKSPAMARYFWVNYGEVNIFGDNGIPLAPFRTNKNDNSRPNGSRQGQIKA